MTKRYIHIGYPKSASTSLQFEFFPKHPEILHLGTGIGHYTGYIDDDVTVAVECYLRYMKDHMYDKNKTKAIFTKYFDIAEKQSKKVVGISQEALSFTFLNDIDITIKAKRLFDIFGKDTIIIMIIRNQLELIKSLYQETIRLGYTKSFLDFLEYTYLLQDRSWFSDFFYDKTFQLYAELFGIENICIIPYELLKESPTTFMKILCDRLGVSEFTPELNDNNAQISPEALAVKLELNQKCAHGLNTDIYEPPHLHRMAPYFEKDLGVGLPVYSMLSLNNQRNMIQTASNLAPAFAGSKLDTNWPPQIEKLFREAYSKSNNNLLKLVELDIEKYDYPLMETVGV